jgi:hypothetical protein
MSKGLTATDAAMWTLSLDPAKCRKMIEESWNRNKILTPDRITQITRTGRVTEAQLKDVTVEALKAACPELPAGSVQQAGGGSSSRNRARGRGRASGGGSSEDPVVRTPEEIFNAECMSCHGTAQAPAFDWAHLDLATINKMLIAMDGVMPPPQTLRHDFNRNVVLGPLIEELKRKRETLENSQP